MINFKYFLKFGQKFKSFLKKIYVYFGNLQDYYQILDKLCIKLILN